MKYLFFCLLLHCCTLIGSSQQLRPGTGYLQVEGGKIWYQVVGTGKKPPLLFIHGGPGGSACAGIAAFTLLAKDRSIIFYDQLGGGLSDRPDDTALWRISRFVSEIEVLRRALNVKELHIVGHSWGAALLLEYLTTKNPTGVLSATFTGPLFSTPVWLQDVNVLLEQMPGKLRDSIKKYEALKIYDAPAYMAATDSFYARHLSVKQWPMAPITDCDSVPPINFSLYKYMWGQTEFSPTGTLRNYDRINSLQQVKQPTLLIAGRHDEARPERMYVYQKLISNSRVVIIEHAGHLVMIDQPFTYTRAIHNFLQEVE